MEREIPSTHAVDVEKAMKTLDHIEMVALAEMFGRWAFNEEKITPDQRTKLLQWAADYEAISNFVGSSWKASDPGDGSAIAFAARTEVKARGGKA